MNHLDVIVKLHNQRMTALERAERAINMAASVCVYSSFLQHAVENVHLARVEENVDFDAKKKLLAEETQP